jgi:NAD(P)-dependent dehydrogenase (short-subunit alcohol dehydrogenase family)
MLLEDKTAVIYGAGGAVGGAVARAFAREGATVVLAGRTPRTLETVAAEIEAADGRALVHPVDALDEAAVQRHAVAIVAEQGRLDVSFNAIGLDDVQGAPLAEMSAEDFVQPVHTAVRTHFYTAKAAATHMAQHGSGVILALTAQCARKPYADVGGFGVACAAIEALCRQLAVELGPKGVRVVCLRSSGSPDAPGVDAVFREHARNAGISREAFEERVAEVTLLKRMPRLAEVANVAVLAACDLASPMTGAIANVTCGEIVD